MYGATGSGCWHAASGNMVACRASGHRLLAKSQCVQGLGTPGVTSPCTCAGRQL